MSGVVVTGYDPAWPQWYARIAAWLAAPLAGLPHGMEHLGSTSLAGASARPLIDLAVACAPAQWEEARLRLLAAGYAPLQERPILGGVALCPLPEGAAAALPSHHLYLCHEDARELRQQRALQALLRAQPACLEAWSRFKERLAGTLGADLQAYTDGKDPLLRHLLQQAPALAPLQDDPAPWADPVAAFMAGYPDPVPLLAASLRGMLHRLLPDAVETLDAPSRIVAYGYGPGYRDTLCTLIPSQRGLRLGVARGASLPDPAGVFSGQGKVHRSIAYMRPADLWTQREYKESLVRQAAARWQEQAP
ncbi:MAG: GrpB family protein [Anaerolineae bacterium]|nr:hypothetical protein [Chloroflexota bacterium]